MAQMPRCAVLVPRGRSFVEEPGGGGFLWSGGRRCWVKEEWQRIVCSTAAARVPTQGVPKRGTERGSESLFEPSLLGAGREAVQAAVTG